MTATTDATPARTGVIVVGSVTADLTTFSHRLPARGETIHGEDFTLVLGGKGANQAVAAGLAGARVSFVACVGGDLFHDLIVDGLTAAGVDITHVRTVAASTGIAHIRVDASAENDIVMVPMANSLLSTDQIDAALDDLLPAASVLLTQLEIPSTVALHAIRSAHARGLTVILDPAPAIALPDDIWPAVDVVIPNEIEGALMTGIPITDAGSAEEAGRWFLDRGAGAALVTLGGAGALLVTADRVVSFPAFPVAAVDTTAAGDAFAGYLGSALAAGEALDAAVMLAGAAGALTVTVRGASPSLPLRAQVDALLAERTASHAHSRRDSMTTTTPSPATATTIDRQSATPMYDQLRRLIIEGIARDSLQPGTALPGEYGLCAQYGVSRTVVRQAMEQLEHEGVVERVKGKGTFVARPKTSESLVHTLVGLFEDVERRGGHVHSEILRHGREPADAEVASALEIEPGTPVVVLERLRSVDGEPWSLSTTWMPDEIGSITLGVDLSETSLYRLLAGNGVRATSGVRSAEATIASHDQAQLLGVTTGAALLRLRSVSRDGAGHVFEYFVAYHRGDRSRFEFHLRATDSSAALLHINEGGVSSPAGSAGGQ